MFEPFLILFFLTPFTGGVKSEHGNTGFYGLGKAENTKKCVFCFRFFFCFY